MSPSFAEYDSQFQFNRPKHINPLPMSRAHHNRHNHAHQPSLSSPLNHEVFNHSHHQHARKNSTHSASTSTATSRSSTATSMSSHPHHGQISIREASLRASEITPTQDIADWAHQMHIRQGRSLWWCQGCFPKDIAEPLEIPKAVEKAITGRRVRLEEASHCYDI